VAKKRADIPITAPMMQALPAVYEWVKIVQSMQAALPKLAADLQQAERTGSVTAARAFLAFYAAKQQLDEAVKAFNSLFEDMKEDRIPGALELEGVTHVPLEEGYRIQTAETMYVSIAKGKRNEAMEWLRTNAAQSKDGGALADLIIETINASTLSAAGRFMLENHSQDLPSELFETYFQPTTSVTKIQKR